MSEKKVEKGTEDKYMSSSSTVSKTLGIRIESRNLAGDLRKADILRGAGKTFS